MIARAWAGVILDLSHRPAGQSPKTFANCSGKQACSRHSCLLDSPSAVYLCEHLVHSSQTMSPGWFSSTQRTSKNVTAHQVSFWCGQRRDFYGIPFASDSMVPLLLDCSG